MTKLIFKKNLNFWQIASFSRSKKLDFKNVLIQALNQNVLIDENKELLEKFIHSFENKKNIQSQLFQDVFASFIIEEKFDKTFLEFGATDGFELSNSFMLEKDLQWKGVLSEPSPQWHKSLKENRKKSKIITKCIWSETGKKLEFFMSDMGALSTIKDFVENDKISIPQNTNDRIKSGKIISVETISLNDVILQYFDGKSPSYISIDTEGSEYEILKSFDFKKYKPIFFTIEHNYTELENKIDNLMFSNNYIRIFQKLTAFDSWFVLKDTFKPLNI